MPKTDHNDESSISGDRTPHESPNHESSKKERFVTDEEWDDLLQDAEQFKENHDKLFRRLSRGGEKR